MQATRVLRITSWIAVEIEEKGELYWGPVAGPVAMVCAESCSPPGCIDVVGVVPVRDRVWNHFTDFVECRCRQFGDSTGDCREVEVIAAPDDPTGHLAIAPGVFVGSIGIRTVTDAGVPGVESGDLVGDKALVVLPARTPKDRGFLGCRHDGSTVPGHVR